jgi:radical SAM superfamily enzyme with C-terminal helix-hairpin-helix motif
VTRSITAVYLIACLALSSLMAGCGSEVESPSFTFTMVPLIDPNTASESELSAVPGLADAAVAAIMAGRPFATPTALHAAIGDGLSEVDQQSIYRDLFIKVDLNTGAEDDYKLIPSTMSSRKLAHEFEEYRPYESMDQFRREMAKYVSEEEVAHLSRYVTLD